MLRLAASALALGLALLIGSTTAYRVLIVRPRRWADVQRGDRWVMIQRPDRSVEWDED